MIKPSEIIRSQFPFSKSELYTYSLTCPRRYKVYSVRKRNERGYRIIAQPSKDLKAVQRVLLDSFFDERFRVHENAKAYKKGASILENAKPHLSNQYLLKMDFKDFFPSIRASDFTKYLTSNEILQDQEEIEFLNRIFFKHSPAGLVLSIGSPGSPFISNSLLFTFDVAMSEACEAEGIVYTRYSDDLTLSTNEKNSLFDWPKRVTAVLNSLDYPSLVLNLDKTVFTSKKFNRHVTGITITNDGKASVGRARKRRIRTQVYLSIGQDSESLKSLQGHIAYAGSVEPTFVQKLWKKYPEQMLHIKSA